jgi:hypothetical protein
MLFTAVIQPPLPPLTLILCPSPPLGEKILLDAEAEFAVANVQLNSYVFRALPHYIRTIRCLKLLDMPLIGDRHPLAYHSDIMALLPADGNVLVNDSFLHGLPEVMRAALVDKVERKPFELAQAAARLPHSTAVQAPVSVNAAPTAAPSSPILAANAALFVPRKPIRPASSGLHSPTSHRPFQGGRRTPSPGHPGRQLPQSPLSSGLCLYHYNFGFP